MRIKFLQNLIDKLNGKKKFLHLENKIANLSDTLSTLQSSILKIQTQQENAMPVLNNIENITQFVKRHFPIYISAKETHSKVFPKYKNCHKGQEMVILGAGPTLDYYTKLENVLHLGVNKTFLSNKADLDYLFVQDYIEDIQDKMDLYKGNNCKKFYGVHHLVPGIAQTHADKAQAERYYFIDCDFTSFWPYPQDLSTMPFNTYSSVIHPAIIFALWTGVNKIYLVGCDSTQNGYSKAIPYKNYKNQLNIDNVLYGWQKLKEYAEQFYPETEIISINPVGLKGLFKDVYTENYLMEHQEIQEAEIIC